MTRPIISALVALLLLALGAYALQSWDVAKLERDNAALSRSVAALQAQSEQSALARQVEVARLEAERVRALKTKEALEAILNGGPDAPLDPALAAIVNGLRAN